ETDKYRGVAGLGARQGITELPSVASLMALRELAKTSRAARPLIGFANPLLNGDPKNDNDVSRARQGRAKNACLNQPSGPPERVARVSGLHSDVRAVFRLGQADIEAIRKQNPLPETADELCALGQVLRADPDDIHLGSNATETAVKRMSR